MESDVNPVRPLLRGLALLTLCGLAACGILKKNEEAQAVVNQRVVGLPAGEFFQAYGAARNRSEQLDGGTTYDWISSTDAVRAGPGWLDERTCSMRIVVDAKGRIAVAEIVLDNIGRTSTSRCGEMFKPK
jgi:hypothetical protein